jgi:hypothetical protein
LGPGHKGLLNQPRSLATLYLRTGVDHLAGLSALLRAREVWFAPGVLARAAFETGLRTFHVLDPECDARARSARAALVELVSAQYSKEAVSHLDRSSEAYQTARNRWRGFRDVIKTEFREAELADDPTKWSVEGERYPNISDLAETWGERRSDSVPGRGVYDALSLYVHPQGYAGREEVRFSGDEGDRASAVETDAPFLARQASAGIASWYDGMRLLLTYHRFRLEPLARLEEGTEYIARVGEPES